MSYKNWDDVRDNRIYAYLNQQELDLFLQAMQIQDIKQKATAARTFLVAHSQQIINDTTDIDDITHVVSVRQ